MYTCSLTVVIKRICYAIFSPCDLLMPLHLQVERREPCGSERSFADSAAAAAAGSELAAAVRQCRRHVDDVRREATSIECLLHQLACSSGPPQRDRVLAAVSRLDRLRQRINDTQRLLGDVDAMVDRCADQAPQRQRSSAEQSRY